MLDYPKWISRFELRAGAWVFVPSEQSVIHGKRIKAAIENYWNPPFNYFHLRNGGHVAAIKLHCNSKSFIHLDIKDFFGSINRSRITRCLKKYCNYEEARAIAKDSTVKHPACIPDKYILPFGFVQSPIIASLCLCESYLGGVIDKLSNSIGIKVSVYMDDIVISFLDKSISFEILDRVKLAAEKSKFTLNDKKEEGPSGKITSFNINLFHGNVEISENRFKKFYLDYYSKEKSEAQRRGYKSYVKSINLFQSEILK